MNATKRAQYKKRLVALENELQAQGSRYVAPLSAPAEEAGGEDEQPLHELLQSIASNRNRSVDTVLKKVARALRKLVQTPDEFGDCEECEEPIVEGRLKAMPYAEFCVSCQAKRDPVSATARRKLMDYQ